MFNDPNFFWKNFRLGTELQISGTFIYNALNAFDQLEHFYYEEQIFEFLYNISVGIERLEKITIILLEHTDLVNQGDFEKTLITHNHLELLKRIRKKKALSLGKSHFKFLQLIGDFYHSIRYSRYNLSSVYEADQSQERLVKFLESELKISIGAEFMNVTANDQKIKNFIGKLISKLSVQLYEIIRETSYQLRLATYEIPYGSKAFKIFIAKEYSFEKERLLQKELLVYLLNSQTNDGFQAHIKALKPLPFGNRSTNYYVRYLLNFTKHMDVLDELEYIREENPFDKERMQAVGLIGEDVNFDEDDEDWE
jgi:hypothetical protein